MSSLSRELVFLILQFLDEEKFKETVHKLEQESAFYFNMKYFEEQVQAGEWDEVERYLCGFTKVEDNRYSMKIFFELRKQKYLEALDRNDRAKAVEILVKDLKIFSTFNEELFKEITQLLTLDNFRQNEQLSKYGDTKSARSIMLVELKKLIEANPLFREKLTLPVFKASRLRTLINQSLNWQHQLCKNPRPNPDIKTLFIDHTCASTNGGRAPPPNHNSLAGPIPKAGVFPPIGAHGPFQPVVSPSAGAIAGWMATNNPSMPHGAIAAGPPGIVQPPVAAAFLKHPRTPPGGPGFEYQMAESEHSMKRARVGPSDEVSFSGSTHLSNMYSPDDLPKTVVRNLNQGSNVMCMDFHPQQQTMLLVGTNVGDISIWEVGSREKVVHKPFKVWDISALSMPFQTTLVKDAAISVTRCIWGPDGTILGVAFSKHIIQIYTYNPSGELRQHLEIDAHVGAVNDIAFAHPNKQLCIVTCGDDKTIKVWDAVAGLRQHTFEGHEAPVYSVCPHYKEQIQFIFSTAIDGKIKAWLYDCLGSRVDYDAPGRSCTTMAYSADGIRLFSCGTSKEGEAHLVEWNESEGAIKREYSGFRKRSMGVVQFDTTRNRFLAAGDEFQIKFWDMDSTNLLTVTDADDGLPVRPKLRFNKEGSLLAVTTSDNGFKILANGDGQRMLRMLESRAYEGSRAFSDTVKPSIAGLLGPIPNASSSMASAMERERMQIPLSIGNLANAESSKVVDIKPRIVDNADKTKSWKLHEIVACSHLKALKLPDPVASSKVMRLIYTNSGLALLALASSAVHKLWKWQKNDRNPSGKSTASVVPQLWQPANGALMSNDVNESKPAEESAACIALSKNDSYVMSASGGKVSLFNMMTFKVMTTFMPPPPAATYLAFHPQDNNIVAIGMEDSTIHIYNVRIDEVKMKLKGHQKQITGLAFSQTLNSLVSAGADAQLCIWNINGWEKRKSRTIQSPPGYPSSLAGETKVQFHNDQRHLLVVHESQIAIYDYQLECLKLWSPRESLSAGISSAIYSCDGLLLFTGFSDGAVGVFDAESLRLRCRIAPSAYISSSISSNSTAYPTVIAAHPSDRNQFALGMSDGSVHVIEPTDADLKPRIVDNADKSKSWKLHEIVDCSHLKALKLPDPVASSKVMRLIYTNSGLALLALASSAVHKLWKWQKNDRNPSGKSTASVVPQLWQPANRALMSNVVNESKPAEESAACIALSKNNSYVMSASGGKVSLFNMKTFKVITTFMPPPPAATYLAFHPQDNNIVAIGMEDSTIHIYNVRIDEVKMKLIGHQKEITGLAFSQTLNSLVSAGADAQLCIWNINGWEKRKSRTIQSPPGYPSSLAGETKVQFHNDQRHLLVVHESQIAIYDYQLECLKLWSPRESLSAGISSAIYSCDGLLLFTGFLDGAVGVFDAESLRLRCRIAPSDYISSSISSNSTAYPTVIAAHPSDPNQFALGMSDGSVHVIEPTDADLKWGWSGAQDNSTLASSNPSNSALNSQPSETPSR